MEAATLPEQDQQEDGAPVEEGAEATRTADHLFQYSAFAHAGGTALDCEHREDGKCEDPDHFHAWVCLTNSLQHRDIQEKARAAKARRKRALRDAGGDGRAASDAYVTLESELDDLMAGDREQILEELADRETRRHFGEYVLDVKEEERFETYDQDKEEYMRLAQQEPEERDEEAFQQLDARMTEFADAIDERVKRERETEVASMEGMPDEKVRDLIREARIAGEANDAWNNAYYTWLAFVGTRKCPGGLNAKRYFPTLEDFRNAPPEAVNAIDNAIKDLEGRLSRGDASGN